MLFLLFYNDWARATRVATSSSSSSSLIHNNDLNEVFLFSFIHSFIYSLFFIVNCVRFVSIVIDSFFLHSFICVIVVVVVVVVENSELTNIIIIV